MLITIFFLNWKHGDVIRNTWVKNISTLIMIFYIKENGEYTNSTIKTMKCSRVDRMTN
jgi:hypothetical protein